MVKRKTFARLRNLNNFKMKNLVCILVLFVTFLTVILVDGQIAGYTAGVDYPNYATIPKGSFSCKSRVPGFYADMETRCQVWHWCIHSGLKYDFLCPNATVFNQQTRVCDWFYNVDCFQAESFYQNNDELYKDTDGNPI